jgi:hypothetical protein
MVGIHSLRFSHHDDEDKMIDFLDVPSDGELQLRMVRISRQLQAGNGNQEALGIRLAEIVSAWLRRYHVEEWKAEAIEDDRDVMQALNRAIEDQAEHLEEKVKEDFVELVGELTGDD